MNKFCHKCKNVKDIDDFHKNTTTPDGHQTYCKECRNAASKEYNKTAARKKIVTKYRNSDKGRISFRKCMKRYMGRHPERIKARKAVSNGVAAGRIKPVSDLKCENCGDHASQYHHHMGYDDEHVLDVVPVCVTCHKLAHR